MDEQKTLLRNDAFLGRGWSFPPVLTEQGVQMSSYEQDIRESLRVLFSTSPGERVNRYDYGCPLRRYAFEPLTVQTTVRLRRGTAGERVAADTPHLHRGAYQQPQQHGLSVLHQRRNKYNNKIKEQI